MRSDLVVISPPFLDYGAGMFQADKPIRIQALVTQPADEALGERVLDRLSGPDEIELNPLTISSLVQGATGKLRPVIDRDDLGQSPDFRQLWPCINGLI